jgi:hypothetical protein
VINLPNVIDAASQLTAEINAPTAKGIVTNANAFFRPYLSANGAIENPPKTPPNTITLTTTPFNPSLSAKPKSEAIDAKGALITAEWYPNKNAPIVAVAIDGINLGPMLFSSSLLSSSSSSSPLLFLVTTPPFVRGGNGGGSSSTLSSSSLEEKEHDEYHADLDDESLLTFSPRSLLRRVNVLNASFFVLFFVVFVFVDDDDFAPRRRTNEDEEDKEKEVVVKRLLVLMMFFCFTKVPRWCAPFIIAVSLVDATKQSCCFGGKRIQSLHFNLRRVSHQSQRRTHKRTPHAHAARRDGWAAEK